MHICTVGTCSAWPGSVLLLRKSLESLKVVGARFDSVDGKDHACAAVTGLTAVTPDGCSVVDFDLEGRESRVVRRDGHESRGEARPTGAGCVGKRPARKVEARLDDSMIFLGGTRM